MSIEIFVEGITDKKFLEDYLKYINKNNYGKITKVKGKDNLYKEGYITTLKTNVAYNIINLVVFDADDNNFANTKQKLEKWRSDNNLKFELFLFPNNRDNGNIETLLEKIAVDKYRIFDCWQGYEDCLSGKKSQITEKTLITPNKKAKIFAYLETLGEETKERDRNYDNNDIWNLNSDYLKPLKEFLEKYLR